ncbi:MAG: chemotaxis protein CheW [Nitrospirae bacterium]|nr:chemotaxis protein CheW [Nitrospirota bacterium]
MSERLHASGFAEDGPGSTPEHTEKLHLVTFRLGEEYGVPIRQVREVVRVGRITVVPRSPGHMEGVINLRGRILPVVNLRKRLKLPVREVGKASRIVVAGTGNEVSGLLVDAVCRVVKVSPESVGSVPEEVLGAGTDYITGVGRLKEMLIILLDLEKLLRREKSEMKEGE